MDETEFYQWLKVAEVYENTLIFGFDIAFELVIEELRLDNPKRRKPRPRKVFIFDEFPRQIRPS